MRAQDVMSSPVVTVRPNMSVRVAASMLALRGFTSAPVVTAEGELLGIVTEAALVRARMSVDQQSFTEDEGPMVGSVVMPAPACLEPGAELTTVAAHMLETGSRSVLIVQDGRLRGIVTARDVLRVVANRHEGAQRRREERVGYLRPAQP